MSKSSLTIHLSIWQCKIRWLRQSTFETDRFALHKSRYDTTRQKIQTSFHKVAIFFSPFTPTYYFCLNWRQVKKHAKSILNKLIFKLFYIKTLESNGHSSCHFTKIDAGNWDKISSNDWWKLLVKLLDFLPFGFTTVFRCKLQSRNEWKASI